MVSGQSLRYLPHCVCPSMVPGQSLRCGHIVCVHPRSLDSHLGVATLCVSILGPWTVTWVWPHCVCPSTVSGQSLRCGHIVCVSIHGLWTFTWVWPHYVCPSMVPGQSLRCGHIVCVHPWSLDSHLGMGTLCVFTHGPWTVT